MAENKLPPVIARELEDYAKDPKKTCPKFFKKDFSEEGYKIVLFQVPKDFDISTIEGKEISVDGNETEILDVQDDENLVIEKLDDKCESYLTNQVLSVLPSEDGKLGIRKKISKVFKVRRKYNVKGIKKRSIIRQVPLSLHKVQEEED